MRKRIAQVCPLAKYLRNLPKLYKKPFLGTLPLYYSASILSFMQRTQFVSLHLIFYGTVKCCLVLTNIHICICTNSTKY